MDDIRFDALTRRFGPTPTRRTVGLAVGGIALALLPLGAPREAQAKHHSTTRRPRRAACASKRAVTGTRPSAARGCSAREPTRRMA